ncbi:hypothetical protein CN326_14970 [Bacillus sp. AFS018417]|nr:hypothetical protein CN326_14970 [Bacillus sp. AFS018417]
MEFHLHNINVEELTITMIQEAMENGKFTSRELVMYYLYRIAKGDKMHISAGMLVLKNHVSQKDAYLVKKLRDAGAIILSKTNMTELANGMSLKIWAGYSARGGQTFNPYGPGEFLVGESSSGSVAAVAVIYTLTSSI